MKSTCSEDFKTDLTFEFWPSGGWKIWGLRHHGSFSFFTWICKELSSFGCWNHSFELLKLQFDILHYVLWYFPHKWNKLKKLKSRSRSMKAWKVRLCVCVILCVMELGGGVVGKVEWLIFWCLCEWCCVWRCLRWWCEWWWRLW